MIFGPCSSLSVRAGIAHQAAAHSEKAILAVDAVGDLVRRVATSGRAPVKATNTASQKKSGWQRQRLMLQASALALAGAVLALTLASPVHAITLINRDAEDKRLQITEGGEEGVTHHMVIAADEVFEGICKDGCIIWMETGEWDSFEGYEYVIIEDGRFVIAE